MASHILERGIFRLPSSVIMVQPLWEFTRFIWWTCIEHQMAKWTDLGYESAGRLLSSTPTIAIYYYYHYVVRNLILLFVAVWRVEDSVDLTIAVIVCSQCPRLYISVAIVLNTTLPVLCNLGDLTPQWGLLARRSVQPVCVFVDICIQCFDTVGSLTVCRKTPSAVNSGY